jgi:hypothetical protein
MKPVNGCTIRRIASLACSLKRLRTTYIDAHDRRAGCVHNPALGSRGVPELLYADDMTLLASNRARMQFLLDRLADYCEAFGMSLNVSKCEVMVFAGTQASHEALIHAGRVGPGLCRVASASQGSRKIPRAWLRPRLRLRCVSYGVVRRGTESGILATPQIGNESPPGARHNAVMFRDASPTDIIVRGTAQKPGDQTLSGRCFERREDGERRSG